MSGAGEGDDVVDDGCGGGTLSEQAPTASDVVTLVFDSDTYAISDSAEREMTSCPQTGKSKGTKVMDNTGQKDNTLGHYDLIEAAKKYDKKSDPNDLTDQGHSNKLHANDNQDEGSDDTSISSYDSENDGNFEDAEEDVSVSEYESGSGSSVTSEGGSYRSSASSLGAEGRYDFVPASDEEKEEDDNEHGDEEDEEEKEDEGGSDNDNDECDALNIKEDENKQTRTLSEIEDYPEKAKRQTSQRHSGAIVNNNSDHLSGLVSTKNALDHDNLVASNVDFVDGEYDMKKDFQMRAGVVSENVCKAESIDTFLNQDRDVFRTMRNDSLVSDSSKDSESTVSGVPSIQSSLCSDVISSRGLRQGWVDRVNASMARQTSTTVPEQSEASGHMTHPHSYPSLKRFNSDNYGHVPETHEVYRSREALRKVASDKRSDRSLNASPRDKGGCAEHDEYEGVIGRWINTRPRTESYKRACQLTYAKQKSDVSAFPIHEQNLDEAYTDLGPKRKLTKKPQSAMASELPYNMKGQIFSNTSAPNIVNSKTVSSNHEAPCKMYEMESANGDIPPSYIEVCLPASEDSEFSQPITADDEKPDIDSNGENQFRKQMSSTDMEPHGLFRKPAVRRRGYAWTSKSLPQNAESEYKKKHKTKSDNATKRKDGAGSRTDQLSKDQGSSLDLAPSLLNIYDDIISGSTRGNNDSDDSEDDTYDDERNENKSKSLPDRPDGRSARLPSLSQPSDRPVSMMEAGSDQGSDQQQQQQQQKKRPLSISSMSSASTSSLPRLRKKRANDVLLTDSGIPCEDVSGSSRDRFVDRRYNPVKRQGADEGTEFESRNSVDSGCVDGDRVAGKGYSYDNMSITSSETGSYRDEREISTTSLKEPPNSSSPQNRTLYQGPPHSSPQISSMVTSPTSFNPSPSNLTMDQGKPMSPTSATGSPFSPNSLRRLGISSTAQPAPYRRADDSGVGSDRSALTLASPPLSPTPPSPGGGNYSPSFFASSPDTDRRPLSSSRSREARKRFFSNYEEHMKQTPPTSPMTSARLADSATPPDQNVQSNQQTKSPVKSPSSSQLQKAAAKSSTAAATAQSETTKSQPPKSHSVPSSLASTSSTQSKDAQGQSNKQNTGKTSDKQNRDKRKGGSTRHDPTSSSATTTNNNSSSNIISSQQRSTHSRSSRKQQALAQGEGGSRNSGSVYVSYVQRVVTEIIESERTYIASLEDIIHGYLEPLAKILKSRDEQADMTCLFSNIRDIYKFGCTFLADLEKTASDPVKVAQCFVKHNKGFVIYTDYCTNYPRAVEVLTRFMQDPNLSELCKERQIALGHGLPLGAYLLRPVQRILKYHLLLQNIVKNCEKEGHDAAILEKAFQHMTEMAHHINEMKRKHEHAVRIQEIQSQLEDYVGEDLTRLGELVLESTFRVYGAKASRQVFLFEKGLLISKKTEGGMLSCKTFIKCSNLMLVEVIPNEPLSFHVIPFNNPRAQYTLQARNMEQKRRWCQEVKRLILESFKGRIPDNVKSLVMQLGREHDDDFVTKEALEAVRKNQHTAPEYLEKRRFRKKSGTRIPDFSLLKPQRVKRDWNKKGDKAKLSPETGRRAESKSPDSHRRIFSKQLIAPKRRSQSQSLPTTPTGENSLTELFPKSPGKGKGQTKSQPVTPSQASLAAIVQPGTALASLTTTLTDRKPHQSVKQDQVDEGVFSPEEDLSDKFSRAESFRKAMRAHPITSEDLDELVARCGGGAISMETTHQLGESEQYLKSGEDEDANNVSGFSLKSRSDMEDSSDDEDNENNATLTRESKRSDEGTDETDSGSNKMTVDEEEDDTKPKRNQNDSVPHENSNSVDNETKDGKGNEEQINEYSRSASLPALDMHDENDGETDQKEVSNGHHDSRRSHKDHKHSCSQSTENVSTPRTSGGGRMSRRDLQNRFAQKKGHLHGAGTLSENCLTSDDTVTERRVPAFHDSYSKRTAERAVLRKKGLRLPNTSKHLAVPDAGASPHPNGIKAKLTDWNSVEKLTKGSMNDLSHLEEDPWEVNPQTGVGNSPKGLRPRGHSDLSEMAKVSSSKENLDWLVYLNRNPLITSLLPSTAKPKQRLSTSALEHSVFTNDSLEAKRRISSQVPYATPPRAFMTPENMRRFGSLPEHHHNSHQNSEQKNGCSPLSNPLKAVTLTRPLPLSSRGVSSLTRCNSNPTPPAHMRVIQEGKSRPSSADMEHLTNESNRIVAEMEEYISRASSDESMKTTPNKFPTTLPSINVVNEGDEDEEEVDEKRSHRLSTASSVSTSSYDSQASSSSDGGMVGTLKSKLHTWAQQATSDNRDDVSVTSTLTSDEDRRSPYEMLDGASGNTFDPPVIAAPSRQDNRQLENVLREHMLGGSVLGARMAHNMPLEPTPHHHHMEVTHSDPRPHSTCGLTLSTVEVSHGASHDPSRFSLPASMAATQALMTPATLNSCDIQQSDSGFSLQSTDSALSETNPSPSPCDTQPLPSLDPKQEATLQLSEPSSAAVSPEVKRGKNTDRKQNFNRTGSCESVDSTDSFYERRLSVALDSPETFEETPVSTIPVVQDSQAQSSIENQPRKHSIRQYVQFIEEKFKPQSPKVFEVRRREPGAMIRQRLETLKESVSYSRQGSEEREGIRSKSQPPSQYRNRLSSAALAEKRCADDIRVATLKKFNSRENLSRSRDSISKSHESLTALSKSRESVFSLSKCDSHHNVRFASDSSSKPSSPALTIRSTNHGHESDHNRFIYTAEADQELETGNQFMHRARSNSDQPSSEIERPSTPGAEGMQGAKSMCKLDQMSSEVDNLVIMKGWVRALISKFQTTPQ